MTPLQFAHILVLGLWGGCVLVEIFMELLALKNQTMKNAIPELHYRIDLYIEGPLLFFVLLTGMMMLDTQKLAGAYFVKVITGLAAVTMNLICVFFVVMRKRAADKNKLPIVEHYTRLVFATAVIGIPCGAASLFLGIRFLGLA